VLIKKAVTSNNKNLRHYLKMISAQSYDLCLTGGDEFHELEKKLKLPKTFVSLILRSGNISQRVNHYLFY